MGTAVIGAPEFRARSGRTVKAGPDGSLRFGLSRGYIAPDEVFDAQEFFQAQRDLELGRWRCPTDPDWVAQEGERDALGQRTVHLFDESTFEVHWSNEGVKARGAGELTKHRVARAFFEAYPERKPWQDAAAGEVWVLTLPDPGDVDAEIVTVATTYGTFIAGSHREWTMSDSRIIAARQVPTEVAS